MTFTPEPFTLGRLESILIAIGLLPSDEALAAEDTPKGLDFDSLDLVEIVMAIEEDIGADIDEANLAFSLEMPFSELVERVNGQLGRTPIAPPSRAAMPEAGGLPGNEAEATGVVSGQEKRPDGNLIKAVPPPAVAGVQAAGGEAFQLTTISLTPEQAKEIGAFLPESILSSHYFLRHARDRTHADMVFSKLEPKEAGGVRALAWYLRRGAARRELHLLTSPPRWRTSKP